MTISTLTTGTLLRRTTSAFGRGFVPFVGVAYLIYAPVLVLEVVLLGLGIQAELVDGADTLLGGLVFGPMVSAGVLYGVFRSLREDSVAVGECLRVAAWRFLPVLITNFVTGLATAAGLCLLIVPGVIVALGLSVAVPVSVVERRPLSETLGRSWKLTRGYRGALFGAFSLLFGLALVGAVGVGGVAAFALEGFAEDGPWLVVLGSLVQVPLLTLGAVAQGVAYHDLRVIKEGLGEEELAAVFE
jgi:hypothetical protein